MKKLLAAALLCAALLPGAAQDGYQALRFRQPLAYHHYIMRDLHRQTAARDAAFAEAARSRTGTGTRPPSALRRISTGICAGSSGGWTISARWAWTCCI